MKRNKYLYAMMWTWPKNSAIVYIYLMLQFKDENEVSYFYV